ncbi:Sec-independent protein translocase subunit TatA [Pseudonocardia acidicola]|uniref:Sec-independent protein translocase protein TatA n=1 Tax=Pseudonocardia acidicola TaxID=2724939 RepID=A0ABX1SHI8_9PSEU|nr:Sec-independent protein translocase subunit TatA [Pseudonocardia acidicola]NMI01036.1 Sec-independent protein translocase subunit TatA [Pseudonocardia acidicola]
MGELSAWHWLIVIGVAVLLFGAKRLPDAARSLGRSTRILKAELRADDHKPTETPAASATPETAPAQPTTAPTTVPEPVRDAGAAPTAAPRQPHGDPA